MIGNFVDNQGNAHSGQYMPLTIPRRPEWDKGMTSHEIDTSENQAFLKWRGDIASME